MSDDTAVSDFQLHFHTSLTGALEQLLDAKTLLAERDEVFHRDAGDRLRELQVLVTHLTNRSVVEQLRLGDSIAQVASNLNVPRQYVRAQLGHLRADGHHRPSRKEPARR